MTTTSNPFSLLSLLCIVLASPAHGVIVNGDFEAGNVGFSSDYIFQAGGNTGASEYTISNNPSSWNNLFGSFSDHTTGSGLMMVVNGGANSSERFWIQSLNFIADQEYEFRMFATNAFDASPAQIALDLNGSLIETFDSSGISLGDWTLFETTFTPASDGVMELSLRNLNIVSFGNDFAIDDLSVTAVPEPSSSLLLGFGAFALLFRRDRRR